MAEYNTCNVCYIDIVSSVNTIECFSCDFIVCEKCCRTFLTSISQLPHCMDCKVGWGCAVTSDLRKFKENPDKKCIKDIALLIL